MSNGIDRTSVIDDIAAALGVQSSELTDDTNLLDVGLDSIRLMSLVEKWRSEGADHVDMFDLANSPLVGAWAELVAQDRA